MPDARQFLFDRLAPLTRSGMVVIVSDAMLVLPAAGRTEGIAVICGTGSMAVGSCQGRTARAGGWGYLLGDEGSGYWIVRAAVRALLDRRDGSEPAGELGGRLLAAAGARDVDVLAQRFYAQPHPRHWARYAPVILDSADPAARQISSAAAAALTALAVTAAGRVGAGRDLPVILAGGLIRHPLLQAAVRSALAGARPGSEVTVLAEPPVAGAVRLAEAAASA